MYGIGPKPGIAMFGLSYATPTSQLYPSAYLAPPTVVDNNTSLIFPTAAPATRLGTGIVRPVAWASAFPQPQPMVATGAVSISTGFPTVGIQPQSNAIQLPQQQTNVAVGQRQQTLQTSNSSVNEAKPINSSITSSNNNEIYEERFYSSGGSSQQAQRPQCVTSWNICQSYDSGRYPVAKTELVSGSAVDEADVDFLDMCDDECGGRPAAVESGQRNVTDQFVARVRIAGDNQSPTDTTASSVWDDRDSATVTIYANDGETDYGSQSELMKSAPAVPHDDKASSFIATVSISQNYGDQSSHSASQGKPTEVKSAIVAVTAGNPRNVTLPPPHSVLSISDPKNIASVIQPSAERWRQLAVKAENVSTRSAVLPSSPQQHQVISPGGQLPAKKAPVINQPYSDRPQVNGNRLVSGVESKAEPYRPYPGVAELSNQVQRQQQQYLQRLQTNGINEPINFPLLGVSRTGLDGLKPTGFNDDRELVGVVFKFLDEFDE